MNLRGGSSESGKHQQAVHLGRALCSNIFKAFSPPYILRRGGAGREVDIAGRDGGTIVPTFSGVENEVDLVSQMVRWFMLNVLFGHADKQINGHNNFLTDKYLSRIVFVAKKIPLGCTCKQGKHCKNDTFSKLLMRTFECSI